LEAVGTTDSARSVVRAEHVVAVGLLLTAVALYERFHALHSGRQYVFCHASDAVDRLTSIALALVLAAGVLSIVGGSLCSGGNHAGSRSPSPA